MTQYGPAPRTRRGDRPSVGDLMSLFHHLPAPRRARPRVVAPGRSLDSNGPATRPEGLTSLILPAYNPGPAVVQTWQQVRDFLREADGPWEVLFVCDGCTDGTPQLLEKLTRSSSEPIRVLAYPTNRGKGYAVRYGFAAARGLWRVFTDVDLAYSFADVQRLAAVLRDGAEAAVACREHPDSEIVLPATMLGYAFRRHLQSRVFGWLARQVLPLRHRDTQAGLKGLRAAAAERILPHLRQNGFGFDCELLTACVHLGVEVTEVPVRVRYDSPRSSTNWRTTMRMLRELFRIRHDWRDGPPTPVALPVEVLSSAA
jgi:dolichyl-phosphate beta-glucosyltransferase